MQLSKIVLLIFSYINFFLYINVKSKIAKNFLLFILLIFLVIPFCFREYFFPLTMGNDYYNYKLWFEDLTLSKINSINNIGFNLFIIFIKKIYNNFIFFLFCCGIFYNYLIIKFIQNNLKNHNQQLFAYIIYICVVYFSSYNILRQCLSCSIFLCSLKYIKNKEKFKYISLILIASSFHISSISLLFLYPYLNNKKYLLKKNMIIIFFIFSYVKFDELINLINYFLKTLFNINYENRYDILMFKEILNYIPALIFLFIYLSLLILNYKNKGKFQENLDLSFLSLIIIILGTKNIIFARLSAYYIPLTILFLPLISNLFNKENKRIYNIVISLLVIYSYLN